MPKKKIITRTRQYLRGLAICLCPRSCKDFTIIREKKYKVWQYSFSLSQKTTTKNPNYQNNDFYILCTGFTMGYKPTLHGLSLRKSPVKNHAISFRVGSSSGSNTTRQHKAQQISHLETSSITNINRNPPKTIPHPCNSSSCPQARRPTEATHSFSFSVVTLLVNMSAKFLDPQIFSSIINLYSTR